jgi:hypothetical protein
MKKSSQISTYAVFVMAARLAGEAIQAATSLQQMPDSDPSEFEDTLQFWHRVRDFNGTAALMCIGATQNRSEEIVARCLRGEKTGRNAK